MPLSKSIPTRPDRNGTRRHRTQIIFRRTVRSRPLRSGNSPPNRQLYARSDLADAPTVHISPCACTRSIPIRAQPSRPATEEVDDAPST